MKSFDDGGLQFAWDSSSIKVWQACPYKYKLKMLDGWQPNGTSVHLWFGSIYAKSLETFHKLRAAGASHHDALREVVRNALIESWDHELDAEGNRIPGTGQAHETMNNLKTRDTLIRSIIWYFDFFQDDPMETFIDANGKPAVEYSFSLPVDDGLVFCGHIDRLVVHNDSLMVQDQKTTGGTLSPYYFNQYSPDTQMSMYTFAGSMIYNVPVKGVVIDAAQIAVGFTRFERGMTFRTPDQLNEWYDDTMWHIGQARVATREQHFPMNPASCGNYGGCEFRRICSLSPMVRQQFLKGDFEQRPRWDPLERR